MVDVAVAFLLFTVALLIAGYYVWSVPEQQASDALAGRLRQLRTQTRSGPRPASDLVKREHRGSFAFLGDFFSCLGVMPPLHTYILQPHLTYPPPSLFVLSVSLT